MALLIYNSLTKKKEEFKPVEENKVKMYVCGMTVYSDAHIGHARTYLAFDVIRRYFEYKGYKVTYVQNITDVDDKIIDAANREGIDALEYSRRYTKRCLEDLDRLGIRRADIYPKASENIEDMIKMIQLLIEKGYAYVADGDVYFSVEKFKDYGKLSGQKIEELIAGARVQPGENKRSGLDFALWKKAKPNEPSWPSPWGYGRPGWHIECSTMSSKYLGLPFDIHGGGMDLRFPHHENEIAQSEAATGKKFANYWMHVGLLTVNGEKMSKSLGNIINIRDIIKKWDAEVIRFFFAKSHYRSPPDFNESALKDTKESLDRIRRLKDNLEKIAKDVKPIFDKERLSDKEKEYLEIIEDFKRRFESAMDDDFNTPLAVSTVFDFVSSSNKFLNENEEPDRGLCRYALDTLLSLCNILTLFQEEKEKYDDKLLKDLQKIASKFVKDVKGRSIEELVEELIKVREEARAKKEWNISDKIRKDLEDIGFEIQDTAKGTVWRKK